MADLLTTLFGSRDSYLAARVKDLNKSQAYPIRTHVLPSEFLNGTVNDSTLISGGTDEERSTTILAIAKSTPGCVVILHNGNNHLDVQNLNKNGIKAVEWDENIYGGMTKGQMIAVLTNDSEDRDLAFFFAFAFDVLETMNKPITIQNLLALNWLDIGWQQELFMKATDYDKALDIMARYDKAMAERAAKAVRKIEQISRNEGNAGFRLDDAINSGNIIVKEIYGSNSAFCKQCLEIIRAKAETGQKFTLILDGIYLDSPVIKDDFRNVNLVLAGADISKYTDNMNLTNRACNIVVFNHVNTGSCRILSENYFGEYDRIEKDSTRGYSSAFMQTPTYNNSVTIRRIRDTRLKPELINSLEFGKAFVRLKNGTEGYILITGGR